MNRRAVHPVHNGRHIAAVAGSVTHVAPQIAHFLIVTNMIENPLAKGPQGIGDVG